MAAAPDVAGLPWPKGDPGDLKDAASRAKDVADAVRTAGRRLAKAPPSGEDWKGEAASSFLSAVADDGRDLEKAAGSFTTVATALSDLAVVLEDAQDDVKRWATKVKDAEDRARKAKARAQQAATTLKQAQAAKNPFMAPLGPADPMAPFTTPTESAEYATAALEATDAQGDLTTVRKKAEEKAKEAVEEVERADRETAGEIKAAADKAPMGGRKGEGGASTSGSKVASKPNPQPDAQSGLFSKGLPGVDQLGPKAGVLGLGAKGLEELLKGKAQAVNYLSIYPQANEYLKARRAYHEAALRDPKVARTLAEEMRTLRRLVETNRTWAGRIHWAGKMLNRGGNILSVYNSYSQSSARTIGGKWGAGLLGAAGTASGLKGRFLGRQFATKAPIFLAGDLVTAGSLKNKGVVTASTDFLATAGEGLVQSLKHGNSSYLLGPGVHDWNARNLAGKNGWLMKSYAQTGELIKEPAGTALDEVGGREGWPFEGDGSIKWIWEK